MALIVGSLPELRQLAQQVRDGADILTELRDRGLNVRFEDGRILASPSRLLDDCDRYLLTEYRELVVAALREEEEGELETTVADPGPTGRRLGVCRVQSAASW